MATVGAPQQFVVACADSMSRRNAPQTTSASGCCLHASSSAALRSGGQRSSWSRNASASERARIAPALRAVAAPARGCRIRTTSGCSRRRMSAMPSEEPSSTTMISSANSLNLHSAQRLGKETRPVRDRDDRADAGRGGAYSGRHQFRERVLDPRSGVEPGDRGRRQQARQLAQPRLPGAGGRDEGVGRHCGQNPSSGRMGPRRADDRSARERNSGSA